MAPGSNNHRKIALIGNPNAGKTSLFNALTGLSQKTGNYAGVTVDRHEGEASFTLPGGAYRLSVLDLPGVYSLYPRSADEMIACRTLLDEREEIDAVVVVLDATNLKRNLLLATQVLDLKMPAVIVLNMIDEAQRQGIHIDMQGLRNTLGTHVVAVDSRRQEGFDALRAAIVQCLPGEGIFYDLQGPVSGHEAGYRGYIRQMLGGTQDSGTENSDKLYRYNIINYLVARYVKSPAQLSLKETTSAIDRVATHRVFGYAILLLVLFLVFQFIFYISETPMEWIESAFIRLGVLLREALPDGAFSDLMVNGVLPGISGVVMFVPQIAFLFMFIGFLEDSGYMARAGFIMDRVMRPFGLNGRSVIPLISGTACAVPSIMATRAISNVKERLITIFILPLISCSARLPVYTLLISILYPEERVLGVFSARGLVLLLLYLLGFAATLLTALVLKRIVRTREAGFFIMELPVYRWPQARNIVIMVWNKVKVFVREAGMVILAISVILWFLSSHGWGPGYDAAAAGQRAEVSSRENGPEAAAASTIRLENSYIGRLGRVIEPVIAPLGFDWKIGIAILTSFAAREVFVGTMSTIYQAGSDDRPERIRERLRTERNARGEPLYSPAVCWSLLLFYAFAMQCISTMAVVHRETKSWRWVIAQFFFMFCLAYASSFAAYSLLS